MLYCYKRSEIKLSCREITDCYFSDVETHFGDLEYYDDGYDNDNNYYEDNFCLLNLIFKKQLIMQELGWYSETILWFASKGQIGERNHQYN